MGGQQVAAVVVDGLIVEALARRPWKLEFGDLPQRRSACRRLGADTTELSPQTSADRRHEHHDGRAE
jgi:hypothetical protein